MKMKKAAAILLTLMPAAAQAQKTIDVTPSYSNTLSVDTRLLYSDSRISAGVEYFSSGLAAAAVKVSSGNFSPRIYANNRKEGEIKLVYSKGGFNIASGIGARKDGGAMYFSPEIVMNGYDNPGMLAAGIDMIKSDDEKSGSKIGGLLAAKYNGVMAGGSRTHKGWKYVAGYPSKGGLSARYFLIDDDGFRRDEFIATTDARGLGTFDFMSALRNKTHSLGESIILEGTNPMRFAGSDMDGRGKGLVIGVVRTKTPLTETMDAEIDVYLTGNFWLGSGYREENKKRMIKMTGGYTPDFFYNLEEGETKIRAELLFDIDTGKPEGGIRLIRVF